MMIIRNIKLWIIQRLPPPLMRSYRWHVTHFKGLVALKRQAPEPPPAMEIPTAEIRLYIGPANYAGQGSAWARAITQWLPEVVATNMAIVDSHEYLWYYANYSVAKPIYLGSRSWNHRHREAMLGFTHVLIEAFLPNARHRFHDDVVREVEWLTRSGVSVGWMCHGTEIRLPSRHRASEPWSPYLEIPSHYLEDRALRNMQILHDSNLPAFVSTPDLLTDVPRAIWCPVVVDPDRWRSEPENAPLTRGRLRVLHFPTHRVIKGTDLILPTLQLLEEEGVLDLQLVEGVPNAEMPARMARADVVVDQFRLGSYGVAACEAMAAGRVVVAHVSEQVRMVVQERTGYELPIFEATPDSLEGVLRKIHTDRELALDASTMGPKFVKSVHDGRLSVDALRSFLGKEST